MKAPSAPTHTQLPSHVRARGAVRAVFARQGGATHLARLYEAGGLRLRCPDVGGACEGVLINTAGGLAGGDTADYQFEIGAGAAVTLTSVAAEKIYRSDAGAAQVTTSINLGPGAQAEWLPQETILFDGGKLERRLEADIAPGAALSVLESLVFGRLAMGEAVRSGALRDRWRIRRGGALIFAEELRLGADMAALLDRPALGGGARACATFLHVGPDAEARLDRARAALSDAPCEAAASAFDGMLVARLLARDPSVLRAALTALLGALRGRGGPRVWG